MIKTVQHIRTGNASPSSAEVPSLLSLLDALIAAGTGDELAVARHIDDLSRRLYQVPPAASIDLEAMARMRQIVTERSDDVALAVGAIEILAGWHQQIGAATLTEWLAVWLGEAAKRAERWVLVSADLGALADLARTVLALSTLFGMLEANPTDGVAFVELAAAALLHHRDHDQALSLAVAGFAWRQASGLPSGPLDAGIPISGARLLRSCADTALGSLTQQSRDPRRTVRESLAAYEMLGLEQQAQRTRLQLVLGMRSEGLLQSVEPLLEQLSQQRDEDPVVGAVIESVWVSVLWSRGDCERALSRAHTLLAGAPHQLRDTVTVQVATMLAADGEWQQASEISRPVVDARLLVVPAMQEPQASESAALLSWAAHIALQAGDLVRCDTLLAALQAYRPITLLADERVAHLQGRIAAASGDLDAAVEHLNRALAKVRISLEEVESDTRAGGRAPDDRVRRQELTAMSADLRAELCDIHARCTDPQAAFVAAELLRGEFLRAARLNPPGTYAGLAAFLDRVIQQLPVGNEPRASAQRTAAEQAILQLRKQPLRELIDTPTPPPGNIAGDLQTILDAAGSTSCVVTLNLSPDALTLVATDGFRYCCDRVETNGQQLANQIRALFSRETSAGPNPDSPQWRTDAAQCVNRMQQLTARRIVSLARHLNRPDVILSTSGPLTCVPWAAVITDPQLTFSVTQGVTLAAEALSTHTRSPRATDVIVAPSGDQSIPAAALEAAAIAQTWKDAGRPTQLLAPVDQALLGQAAPRARVLHLASHASWKRTAAVSGGITLSEGRLDAGELFAALDLTRTDLAVLSACDTAASMFAPGGEAINLAQLVLSGAGAGQVIASLWPVDDLATGLLMVRLHEDLASRLTPSRALVKAQRWLQNLTYSMAITEVNRRWTQLPASVESRLDQWRTAPPNGHPFDGVEFYAAFGCFGVAPPQT